MSTTEDERFAILTVSERGKGKQGNAIFYKDLSNPDAKFMPIVADISNEQFGVIDNVGDKFLVRTNRNAPNGRVVLIDPTNPAEANWKDVLPERRRTAAGHRHCRRQTVRFVAQRRDHACVRVQS